MIKLVNLKMEKEKFLQVKAVNKNGSSPRPTPFQSIKIQNVKTHTHYNDNSYKYLKTF